MHSPEFPKAKLLSIGRTVGTVGIGRAKQTPKSEPPTPSGTTTNLRAAAQKAEGEAC